ncbi:hypothetical protein ASPVEDRAFT_149299 [Aspergillus versicolor CBS 583.65]|uniref:Mitochondrial division protein 1 n=1 Tax=Aspergillus versicolor CBS 583.65 TaxID=1036611 RepID=A0A1L9PFP5_ASPVE|nr:uncharacterized protein ASPVEDRAFT_149299 [Aspergillus versicolor CBS 583.65]OJJ00338.1 hypothetical protein ASPVEDRAFT_149299 [Aspergillus versicolor CBS 583.65]
MEGTYMPILNQLLTNTDEEETRQLMHEFKNTIGILILFATPLSVDSFVNLVQIETDTVRKQFKLFQSVLDVPATPDEPVRISHISFRDFLLDNKQEESPFWIDKGLVHKRLGVQCLKVMQHGLRKNICNLQHDTPRNDIDQENLRHCLPSELQYACRYWVHHLIQNNPVTELTQVVSFLESHFLHWVEAMSLLGALSDVVEMVQRLRLAIPTYENHQLSGFMSEAWHFILRNRQIAETSPLQLYSIGLMFTKEGSIFKRAFKNESSPWSLAPRVKDTGTGLSSWLRLVAFSPDGQLLASGTDDHTVKVWDPRTGELLQTLKGHLGWVSSVSFSLDSQLLASASFDQTVKVWDAQTGELRRTFGGYFHEIYSVTFLPDDQLTTSSGGHTVKVWDVRTGELLKLCE